MKPKVYLETTIVSYLTAWRSQQLVVAANQETTRGWWDEERHRYELYISEAVLEEASAGDPEAVRLRLDVLATLAELEVTDSAIQLAKKLMSDVPLPERASIDALHIAVATVNGMDYLLTWNCRHIANASLRTAISAVCESAGYGIPVICTPFELLEEHGDD